MLVTSADRHDVQSLELSVTEPLPASVDRHGLLETSSLPVKVMSVPYVVEDILDSYDDGHGVVVMMLVSSVN